MRGTLLYSLLYFTCTSKLKRLKVLTRGSCARGIVQTCGRLEPVPVPSACRHRSRLSHCSDLPAQVRLRASQRELGHHGGALRRKVSSEKLKRT